MTTLFTPNYIKYIYKVLNNNYKQKQLQMGDKCLNLFLGFENINMKKVFNVLSFFLYYVKNVCIIKLQ